MINKVILMGRLTADPELKQTQSGIAVCRFTVAIDRGYKSNETGEKQADFINVVAWRQTAEFVSKYFSKGKMIIIEGELQNNNFESNGVKHYSFIVKANNVTFGESKSAANSQQNQPKSNTNTAQANDSPLGDLDDFEEILGDGEVPF